jgi:hypothetical protein
MRAGDIADVENHRGFLDFFQSGSKGCHQSFGKIADKADRVGEQHAAAGGKSHCADSGIERSEHARRDQHFGLAEGVEKRGFASVGITDQGYRAERHSVARLTAQRTLFAHIVDAVLDFANAIANAAAVRFEFLFTGSANADAPSATTRAACAATATLAA